MKPAAFHEATPENITRPHRSHKPCRNDPRMDSELLQQILACPTLPSLPAVAVQVLELTGNPDVRMDELARTIQADQALSAKILRTVNSSFYGLRRRCTSIDKALVLLGLGPVKGLVLGFSLVSSLGEDKDLGFDYMDYWRRGLNTAVAGKLVANACKFDCGDEAFLAGLFQDMGMVACYRAIGARYAEVVASVGSDHAMLSRAEMLAFEMRHADIGAELAGRWRLPQNLVIPLKYHERPTACPTEHSRTARCVALGNLVHGVLVSTDPTAPLREAYRRAEQWLALDAQHVDGLIRETGAASRELGALFNLNIAAHPNPDDVLARADRRMIEMARSHQMESYAGRELADLLSGDGGRDPLTGVLSREAFAQGVREAFSQGRAGEIELSIAQFATDGLGELLATQSRHAQDEVVLGLAVLLLRVFEPMGGVVARVTETDFAVILPRVGRRAASDAAEQVCGRFPAALQRWLQTAPDAGRTVRVSAGVATLDAETAPVFETPELLVESASRAVQAARGAGGGCVRVFVPRTRAA